MYIIIHELYTCTYTVYDNKESPYGTYSTYLTCTGCSSTVSIQCTCILTVEYVYVLSHLCGVGLTSTSITVKTTVELL